MSLEHPTEAKEVLSGDTNWVEKYETLLTQIEAEQIRYIRQNTMLGKKY